MKNRAEQSGNTYRSNRGSQALRAMALATGLAVSATACGHIPNPLDRQPAEEKYAVGLLEPKKAERDKFVADDNRVSLVMVFGKGYPATCGVFALKAATKVYESFADKELIGKPWADSTDDSVLIAKEPLQVSYEGNDWIGFLDPTKALSAQPTAAEVADSLAWVEADTIQYQTSSSNGLCRQPGVPQLVDVPVQFTNGKLRESSDLELMPGMSLLTVPIGVVETVPDDPTAISHAINRLT